MATAWRSAVVPMSARFASMTTGMPAGTLARSRSSAASPADPYASKKARLGLTAARRRGGRLDEQAGEPLHAGQRRREDRRQRRGLRVEP